MTPHQRRIREHEALLRVIADLEALLRASKGMIPAEAIAATVDRNTSSLPASSPLVGKWTDLAAALRRGPDRIADARVREFIAKRRLAAEDLARWIEAREAKLRADDRQGTMS